MKLFEKINFYPEEELKEKKKEVGELKTPEYRGGSFAEAHYQFGREQKKNIHRAFDGKLKEWHEKDPSGEEFKEKLVQTERCRRFMKEKLKNKEMDPVIRDALKEYFDSLNQWTEGADLPSFLNEKELKGLMVKGKPIDAELLALFLQNDNVGCQTFISRGKNGDIFMLHSEEDDESWRVIEAKFATFRIKDKRGREIVRQSFSYPDLLPGSAFTYSKNYFAACDFLYMEPDAEIEEKGGSLANAAVWINWRLGGERDIEEIVKELGPFLDGYAVNIVRVKDGRTEGENFVFAGDMTEKRILGAGEGEMLSQVNIFNDKNSAIAKKFEKFPEGENRAAYEHRLELISSRAANVFKEVGDKEFKLKHFRQILTNTLTLKKYKDYATASPFVKANITLRVKPEGRFGVYFGAGPAVDVPEDYIIYTNTKDKKELRGGWL